MKKTLLALLAFALLQTSALAQSLPNPSFVPTWDNHGQLFQRVGIPATGMVCDNVADDAPAYQAALNAAVGHVLILPPNKQCRIKSYVGYPSNSHVIGQNTTLNFDAAATGGGSLNLTMMIDGTSNIIIEGVIFNGPGTAITSGTTPRFMAACGSDRVQFIGNTFRNFGNSTNNTTAAATYAQGFAAFCLTNSLFYRNTFTGNSGDGLALSNNSNNNRIIDNIATNNHDSGIVACTVGGNNVVASLNTISGNINFALGSERCQGIRFLNNTISAPGTHCIRIARYLDSPGDYNQDIGIEFNRCTGGGLISIESSGTTQGSVSVPKGGLFKVVGNTVISPSGAGISISDSTNGDVIGNTVTGAGAEGIVEQSFVTPVGNNIISNNRIDGATIGLRQLNVSGSVLPSTFSGNVTQNTSVASQALLSVRGVTSSLSTPSSSSETCEQSAMKMDVNFIYICVAGNVWRRAALSAF